VAMHQPSQVGRVMSRITEEDTRLSIATTEALLMLRDAMEPN
jgi:hypothetical protein